MFAFTSTDAVKGWDVFALLRALHERGWQVPAYSFSADPENLPILRIVCRNGLGLDLADLFLEHLDGAVQTGGLRFDHPDWPNGFRH